MLLSTPPTIAVAITLTIREPYYICLLILDFSQAGLTGIPGGDVFNVGVAETTSKPTHDRIRAAPITEAMQCLTEVVLLLSTQVRVDRLGAGTRWAVTGLTGSGFTLTCRGAATG